MGHCLKSAGCRIWPVSRWSHGVCCGWKCSVTEGLTGKHEVREDVKRKGLLKSSWWLVLITLTQQWPTFPVSDWKTKVLNYILRLCNHSNTLSLIYYSYKWSKVGGIICAKVVGPLPVKVTCLHVRLTVQKQQISRICPLRLPSCAQMFPDWRGVGTLVH